MVLDPADSCFLSPAQYWSRIRQAPATGHPSAAAIARAQDSSPGSLRFGVHSPHSYSLMNFASSSE